MKIKFNVYTDEYIDSKERLIDIITGNCGVDSVCLERCRDGCCSPKKCIEYTVEVETNLQIVDGQAVREEG